MASRPVIGSVAVSVVPSAERFADVLRAKLLGEADRIGDEVGDILKARIEAKLGQILIPVKIDDALAQAKLDEIKKKIDELNGARATVRVRTEESGSGAAGSGGILGWMISLVGLATAIAPAFIVAGVGVAAFAALAVPQIAGVTKYIHDMNLGSAKAVADWASLNQSQKTLAVELIQLRTEFHNVSNAIAPEVLQVFDSVLADINTILPELIPLAKAGATAIGDFLGTVGAGLSDAQASQFFNFVRENIGPDMHLVATTVVELIRTIFNLTEALHPVSVGMLHFISLFAELLQWTSKNVPWLTDIIVLAIALYKPLVAIQGLQLFKIFTWVPGAIAAIKGLIIVMDGLTLSEKAAFLAELAFESISPWGWAILGAAALGGLVFWLSRTGDASNQLVDKLQKQDQATGFNIDGYLKFADALDGATGKMIEQKAVATQTSGVMDRYGVAARESAQANAQVAQAAEEARQKATNLESALSILEARYGITQQQAILLAKAAKVSGDELAAGGDKAHTALKKIELFGDANLKAHGPAHQFALDLQAIGDAAGGATNQIKGLTDAYNAMITPNLTAEGAVVTMKNDLITMTDALKKSKGAVGDHTQAQRDSFSAFNTYITDIQNTESATLTATGAQRAHDLQVLRNTIPELLLLAKNNKNVRGEIFALIKTIEAIPKKENVSVAVQGSGKWSIAELAGGIPVGQGNRLRTAQGALLPTNAGRPGFDSIPILAKPGEAIVPVDGVPFVAGILKARGVPGFASGTFLGDDINNLGSWTGGAYKATVQDMALSVKDAITKGIQEAKQSASHFGGGFGPIPSASGPAAAVARALFPWPASMWPAFNAVEMREAGYNLTAQNPTSNAYGVAQFINGPSEYFQWGGNPFSAAGQFTAMFNYIRSRYGNPLGAWAHELAFGWYDKGGWLPPGASIAFNGSSTPEPILSGSQWSMLSSAFANGGGGGGRAYHAHFEMPDWAFESRVRDAFTAMDMTASLRERVGRRN